MLASPQNPYQEKALQKYLLGLDLGAGSLKATIIDASGRLMGEAAHPVTTQIPRFGWSEQDPAEWFAALCAAVPAALKAARLPAAAIAGIGISAGAHIPVLTDAAGTVLRPAIMWNDQRAAAQAAALHEKAGAKIIETALNRANPTWTLAMLAWLQENEPATMARAQRLYLAKDWLRARLTGTWETDFSDAIGAMLADNATKNWSPELAALIGLDPALLPPIVAPEHIVGFVTEDAAARTGLSIGTPVICGSNDTTVEFFGIGATAPGMGAIKLATAGVLYLATQGPEVHPPISCYPHIMPGLYYAATGTNSCASAHRWLRELMFAEGGFEAMDALGAAAPPGARGLLFHPYLQGERAPYWDPLLRADFIGLTISHGRPEFARAMYEGLAFSIRDLLEAARALGFSFGAIRLMGGGARSACWRQIIADVTGLTIERTEASDASFGAALLAGIGTGIFAGPEDAVARCVRLADSTSPDPERGKFYDELFRIYKDAQSALAGINHRLHDLVT
jgi:xylulokinase